MFRRLARPGAAALFAFNLVLAGPIGLTASVAYAENAPLKISEGAVGGDITSEMQYVADYGGFFAKQGLAAEEVTTQSGVSAVQALLSGNLDVVSAGGATVLRAIEKGAKLTIIAPDIDVFPYYLVVGKGITKPQDLKGKAIAVSSGGSSSYYGVVTALSKFGIPLREVSLRQAGGESGRLGAVVFGAAAATAVGPQLLSKVKGAGLTVLFDFAPQNIQFNQDFFVATTDFVRAHPDFVQKYRNGLLAARAFFEDPANKKQVLALFAKLFHQDPTSPEVADAYNYTQEQKKSPYFYPEGLPLSREVFESTKKIAGITDDNIDLSKLVAPKVPIVP